MQSIEEFHTAGSASGLSIEPARYQKSEIIKVDLEAVLNYMGKQFNNCYQNKQMNVDSGCCLPHGPLNPLILYTQVPFSQSALADPDCWFHLLSFHLRSSMRPCCFPPLISIPSSQSQCPQLHPFTIENCEK